LNALKKGIGIDQLTNQFSRMFNAQEQETRQFYEDNAADARDERRAHERHQLESTEPESRGDPHKDKVRDMAERPKPFCDTGGHRSWEEPMGEVNWREIAWSAAEDEEMKMRAQGKKRAPGDTKHDKQPPEFRFRLNGEIMPEIFVQRALVDGEPVGQWEIGVDVDGIGRFTIDDNSDLWDPALPQFVLEFRDETSWALLPIPDRQASVDKGWNRTTPHELVEILESAGAIKRMQREGP
jgi:hypothetical protein